MSIHQLGHTTTPQGTPAALVEFHTRLSQLADRPRPVIQRASDVATAIDQLETLRRSVRAVLVSDVGRTLDAGHTTGEDPQEHPVSWLLALLGEWESDDARLALERLELVRGFLDELPTAPEDFIRAMIGFASASLQDAYARLDVLCAATTSLSHAESHPQDTGAATLARSIIERAGEILSLPGASPAAIAMMVARR